MTDQLTACLKEKENIRFESERLILKTLLPEEISQDYIDGLNNSDINEFLVANQMQQKEENVKEYVMGNLRSGDKVLLGIFTKEDDTFIGTIRISFWAYHFIASIGILIFSTERQRKGYACEAVTRVVDFVFNSLKLRCVEAQAYIDNVASIKLFKKSGFQLQSKVCQKYRLNDKFTDILVFNRFNKNFNFSLINPDIALERKELCT